VRVLYHHRTQAEDAQGIHISETIRCFRNQGHEVEEIALVESADGQKRNREGSRRLGRLRAVVPDVLADIMAMAYTPFGYVKLANAVRRFRPDFIYERYALYNAAGVLAGRRFRLPVILEVNAPLALEQAQEGKLGFRRLARRVERWICANATITLCVSTPLKQILASMGVPESRMKVMPNGVNPDEFHGRDTGAGVRQRYGLMGKRVVGFVGWVRSWHGLAELVAGMGSWPRALDDVEILIVGDGPARCDIEQAAAVAGVEDRVHITGAVDRTAIVDHIAALDIALQPAATAYASPMKIFEYLAMGKPVVAPRQPNIEEVLTDGVDGLLFTPGDTTDLVRCMRGLLEQPEIARGIGSRARSTIMDRRFLWCDNARAVIDMVSALRSAHRRDAGGR
jgi:glycosyltransferase involved in cell wall biosynthesis